MLYKLFHSFQFLDTGMVKMFETSAKKQGLQKTAQTVLDAVDIKVVSDKKFIFPDGPLLIISNHHGGQDLFCLLSLINRKDYHYTALASYKVFGATLSSNLLPIYRTQGWNHKLFEYPLHLLLNMKMHNLNANEARQENRKTIAKASELVSQGKVVSIFPQGTVGKNSQLGTWKPGVGYLIKSITNPETKILFIHIQGSNKTDLLRYVAKPLRDLFFKPKTLTVTFSKIYTISDLDDSSLSAKELTTHLEKKYNNIFFFK